MHEKDQQKADLDWYDERIRDEDVRILVEDSGPRKTIALPARCRTRYAKSARPVRPMSSLVPTDDENTRRTLDGMS